MSDPTGNPTKQSVHNIRAILQKISGKSTNKRKRKEQQNNPLALYVAAMLQPHIINGTRCKIPFKLVSEYENTQIYNVEGNPPIEQLVVHIRNNAIADYELE